MSTSPALFVAANGEAQPICGAVQRRSKVGCTRGLAGRCSVDNGVEVHMYPVERPQFKRDRLSPR
jgi:hypothetical protein